MKTSSILASSRQTVILLVGVALLTAVLAGCSGINPQTGSLILPPLPQTLNAPVDVVVNDVTTHDRATSDARIAAFEAVVRSAFEHRAGLVLVTAGATPASVHVVFSTVAVSKDVNGTFVMRRQSKMMRAMVRLFRTSDAQQVPGDAADVITALREVQSELRSTGSGRFDVLVMSSGQLSSPIDTSQQPQYLAAPAVTAEELSRAGWLPDLASWQVTFQSVDPASGTQMLRLTALWWAIMHEAGGQLTGFQQDVVEWPEPAMAEPPTPGIVTMPAPAGKIIFGVSDSDCVLFDYNEATLRPDAAPIIRQLVAALRQYPYAPVRITGYTDSTGSPAYNLRLSRARAAAVARALVVAGIPGSRLTVDGLGASHFVAGNSTPAQRQANRRVEIELTVK